MESQFDNVFQGSSARVSTEALQKSSEGCKHEYRLDEEIGILCPLCGFVSTEIKYVTPDFVSKMQLKMKLFCFFCVCSCVGQLIFQISWRPRLVNLVDLWYSI